MNRSNAMALWCCLIAALLATEAEARELETLSLPVRFEKNEGQFPDEIRYVARVRAGTIFAARDRLIFSPDAGDGERAELRFIGANADPKVHALHELRMRSNYYRGGEPGGWLQDVRSFERVRYADLYAGIHLELYGTGSSVEFDLIVEPGADPNEIRLQWSENAKPKLQRGDIVVTIGGSELRLHTPITYQLNEQGARETLQSEYRSDGNASFRFRIANFNRGRTLVIDPVITFSSYLGGNNIDEIAAVKTDALGNIYLAGHTRSLLFLGIERTTREEDLFVIKLSPDMEMLFVTLFGGAVLPSIEKVMDLAIHENGHAYVIGVTSSPDFPLVEPLQSAFGGGHFDAYIARFDAEGRLSYSTFLGGSADDGIGGRLAVDPEGAIYACFSTYSGALPLIKAIQHQKRGNDDLFLVKLSPDGDRILFSTYLGGSGSLPIPNELVSSVLIDPVGNVVLVGHTFSPDFPLERPIQGKIAGGTDMFVAKIAGDDGSLLFSTFFGGSGFELVGANSFTAELDTAGDLWLAATTKSADLPLVAPAHSSPTSFFLAKLRGDGTAIDLSTYLPAPSGNSQIEDLAISPDGSIFLGGQTNAGDLPLIDPIPMALGGLDGFVMKVSREGKVISATYLGGSGSEMIASICTDRHGNLFVAGETYSSDFPLVAPLRYTVEGKSIDGFLVRLSYPPAGSGRRRAVRHGN